MKHKRIWIIAALLLVLLGILYWIFFGITVYLPHNADSPELTSEPAPAAEDPAPAAEEPAAIPDETALPETGEREKEQPFLVQVTESDPAIAYALVRMSGTFGLLPLPTEGEYSRTIRQAMPDGSEAINILHLTTNGIRMEDANCEGHDCIDEGEVTLENREERVLWNMIICLPHQLSVELITRTEAEQMLNR